MLGTPSKSKQTGQAVHKTPNFLNTIMKNMEGGGEKWRTTSNTSQRIKLFILARLKYFSFLN